MRLPPVTYSLYYAFRNHTSRQQEEISELINMVMRNIANPGDHWYIKALKHSLVFYGNGYGPGALVQHKANPSAGVGIVVRPSGMRVGEIYGDWNLVECEYEIAGWDRGCFPVSIKDTFGAITDLKLIKSVNKRLDVCYNIHTVTETVYV